MLLVSDSIIRWSKSSILDNDFPLSVVFPSTFSPLEEKKPLTLFHVNCNPSVDQELMVLIFKLA